MSDLLKQAAELEARAAVLKAQAAEEIKAQRTAILAQLKVTIAEYSFTANELGAKNSKAKVATTKRHPSAGIKVPPKYKDSNGNTWSGRGVQPAWLVDAQKNNAATLESFAVSE